MALIYASVEDNILSDNKLKLDIEQINSQNIKVSIDNVEEIPRAIQFSIKLEGDVTLKETKNLLTDEDILADYTYNESSKTIDVFVTSATSIPKNENKIEVFTLNLRPQAGENATVKITPSDNFEYKYVTNSNKEMSLNVEYDEEEISISSIEDESTSTEKPSDTETTPSTKPEEITPTPDNTTPSPTPQEPTDTTTPSDSVSETPPSNTETTQPNIPTELKNKIDENVFQILGGEGSKDNPIMISLKYSDRDSFKEALNKLKELNLTFDSKYEENEFSIYLFKIKLNETSKKVESSEIYIGIKINNNYDNADELKLVLENIFNPDFIDENEPNKPQEITDDNSNDNPNTGDSSIVIPLGIAGLAISALILNREEK
jgi:hypothetical protein